MTVQYPERICCLTEETTEVLYALGEEDRIVGISGFTVRPKRARKEKPKVSAFIDADIPKIESLKPDLILAFSDIQADITRELIARGQTVFTFNQRTISEILNTIVLIGSLVGRQADAEVFAQSLAENVERVRLESAKVSRRPKVYFEEWPDPMISGIAWVSELIEIAGGEDIFAEKRSGSLAKDRFISSEDVLERKPDIIIGSWCGKKVKKDQIMARPLWETIPAVQDSCIYEIDSSLILQPGPAALTDGLAELRKIIMLAQREVV